MVLLTKAKSIHFQILTRYYLGVSCDIQIQISNIKLNEEFDNSIRVEDGTRYGHCLILKSGSKVKILEINCKSPER